MTSKVIDGYTYSRSNKKGKKLMVTVNNKTIHFGSADYGHYFDRTGLLPVSGNHEDDKRRLSYLKRSSKIKNADGFTINNPESANYHAIRILW
jgi:hypothetical protein